MGLNIKHNQQFQKRDPTACKLEVFYLNGGGEGRRHACAEARGHAELGHVLLLVYRAGDDLTTQQLQAGDPMLDAEHVQHRAAGEEQTRVPVTPAQGTDRPLNTDAETSGISVKQSCMREITV